ncbi:flippase [Vibrio chagasii]|uniref:flippase n=1 Tax=Vibrio chagasii TaxID=170679 RepID=UPI004068AA38
MELGKAFKNIKWLFFDKIVKLLLALVTTSIIAKALGPADFGILSLAISIVVIISSLSALGINQTLTKYLLLDSSNTNKYLSSAVLVNFSVSLIVVIVFYLFFFTSTNDNKIVYLLAIVSTSLLFKSSNLIRCYFEAKVESKSVVIIDNLVVSLGCFLKIIIIYLGGGVEELAYVFLLESIVLAIGFVYLLNNVKEYNLKFIFDFKVIFQLISEGWPLLISASAWIIYTRIDQIMIAKLIGDESVGFYVAATTVSDLIIIIPTVLGVSLIPIAVKNKGKNNNLYNFNFQLIHDVTNLCALLSCLLIYLTSDLIISVMFGDEYIKSVDVLSVHAWTGLFITMAFVSGRYMIYEGNQKITMYRHVLGILINIPLNYVMILEYGVVGAAWSTLICLAITNLILDAFLSKTKQCFIFKVRSFALISLSRELIKRVEHKNG